MLHVKITRFSISVSVYEVFFICANGKVPHFQCSNELWEKQVLCRYCAGNEELVTLCVFTGYLISSFLEIQGVCKLVIGSLWPL